MNDKLMYNGYIKGAFSNDENREFALIFGDDYDSYLFDLNFEKGKNNITEKYSININKLEDTLINAKYVYLPKEMKNINIDLNVANNKDIDYFDIDGLLAINNNNIYIYKQNLMPASIYQLQNFLELNSDLKEEYLKDLYHENYEIIDYPVSSEPLNIDEQINILEKVNINDLYELNKQEQNIER